MGRKPKKPPVIPTIEGKRFDDPKRPYIIAEASGNHNKDIGVAHALVDAAASAGADAIKFQTFTASEIASDTPLLWGHDDLNDAKMKRLNAKTLRDQFEYGGLPRDWHMELKKHAGDVGLTFLSTPFSPSSLKFLIEEIGVPALKIASGDLTYTPLLNMANDSGLPVILSTGMGTLQEIRNAVSHCLPKTYSSKRLAILHCRSIYPCPPEWLNMRAIARLRYLFPGAAIGFSDHTIRTWWAVPSLAVSLGATVFEKHLKMTQSEGPDIDHSITPPLFAEYVRTIRDTVTILGEEEVGPHPQEAHDRLWGRRSVRDWKRPQDEARQGQWE